MVGPRRGSDVLELAVKVRFRHLCKPFAGSSCQQIQHSPLPYQSGSPICEVIGIAFPEEAGAIGGRNVREYRLRRNAFSQCWRIEERQVSMHGEMP